MQLAYCGHLGGVPQLKHINYETCIQLKEALNFKEFRTWCVIRHPVDKSISWYNYRRRRKLKGKSRYLGGMSYREFLTQMTPKDRNECDDTVAIMSKCKTTPEFIFDYSNQNGIMYFLKKIYSIDELPKLNTSSSYNQNYLPDDEELKLAHDKLEEQVHNYNAVKTVNGQLVVDTLRSLGGRH